MAKTSKCKVCGERAADHTKAEVITCLAGVGINVEYTEPDAWKVCHELGILKGMGQPGSDKNIKDILFTDGEAFTTDKVADVLFQKALTKVKTPKKLDDETLSRIDKLGLPNQDVPVSTGSMDSGFIASTVDEGN